MAKSTKDSKPNYRISQSLIKSLRDYKSGKGVCGLQLKSKYIDGQWDLYPASDIQQVGTWFEYKITGAVPKNGIAPEPIKTQKGELTAPFKRMEKHIEHFKKLQMILKFDILEIGSVWVYEDLSGVLDLFCLAKQDIIQDGRVIVKAGQKFIVDIKTTGLLDDKWNEYGWNLNNLGNKDKLITQPIHYKYLGRKIYGEDFPFIFFLFHTNNENDFRIIHFEIDEEEAFPEHEDWINWTRQWMDYYVENGFTSTVVDNDGVTVYPSVKTCEECPIKQGCKEFRMIPPIQTFSYSPVNIDSYNN